MEDKRDVHASLPHDGGTNSGLVGPATVYHENSQGPDAFQLNRLLNFNVSPQAEVERKEFLSEKKQLLNFSVPQSPVDGEQSVFMSGKKQRPVRDPLSHRIIEKRRRDRMNNCLADLSVLIPSPYLKQGQGRIEKTEIIEMAIKHIGQLQARLDALGGGDDDAKVTCCSERFCHGYNECRDNVMRYVSDSLGYPPGEAQAMYKFLDTKLEARKALLPALCNCKRPAERTVVLTSPTAAAVTPAVALQQLSPVAPVSPGGEQLSKQLSAQQQQQQQPTIVFPVPVTVPLLSPAAREPLCVATSVSHPALYEQAPAPAALPAHASTAAATDKLTSDMDLQVAAAAVVAAAGSGRMTSSEKRPRHASLPGLDSRNDASLHSPAFSETSTTPVVGDDCLDRQSSLDFTIGGGGSSSGGGGSHEKRRKLQGGGCGDSGIVSTSTSSLTDMSSSDASRGVKADMNGDVKNSAAYHFKKDITWRFTADADKALAVALKDSAQGKEHDVKDAHALNPTLPNSASEYGSDFSTGNGSNNGNGSKGSSGEHADCSSVSTGFSSQANSSSSSTDASLNNTVPAFALHPMGVYYIPIVLPVSQVMPFMKNHRSMGICHPISIPVSFTGPFHMGIPHAATANNGLTASDINTETARSNKLHHRHLRHGTSSRRNHGDGRGTHARRDAGGKRAS